MKLTQQLIDPDGKVYYQMWTVFECRWFKIGYVKYTGPDGSTVRMLSLGTQHGQKSS